MQPASETKWAVHAPKAAKSEPDQAKDESNLINSGTVDIKVGNTTAVVHHGLGVVPVGIKVDFPPGVTVYSYIVGITNETFQVNLDHSFDHDVNFIWSATAH